MTLDQFDYSLSPQQKHDAMIEMESRAEHGNYAQYYLGGGAYLIWDEQTEHPYITIVKDELFWSGKPDDKETLSTYNRLGHQLVLNVTEILIELSTYEDCEFFEFQPSAGDAGNAVVFDIISYS